MENHRGYDMLTLLKIVVELQLGTHPITMGSNLNNAMLSHWASTPPRVSPKWIHTHNILKASQWKTSQLWEQNFTPCKKCSRGHAHVNLLDFTCLQAKSKNVDFTIIMDKVNMHHWEQTSYTFVGDMKNIHTPCNIDIPFTFSWRN